MDALSFVRAAQCAIPPRTLLPGEIFHRRCPPAGVEHVCAPHLFIFRHVTISIKRQHRLNFQQRPQQCFRPANATIPLQILQRVHRKVDMHALQDRPDLSQDLLISPPAAARRALTKRRIHIPAKLCGYLKPRYRAPPAYRERSAPIRNCRLDLRTGTNR